ncbi:cysteine desulfurase family protein [Nocardioides marmoribigeumensis]|uniref:Cysteine desulfurase n=1 Tax=Nocardioides marmoribigeumensis TaxID=433649 RepID=A0ABU2BPP2_9ACTN|nr:aminotransferase class V-fold PLP-dependent enzyme [Nocardioides marmoribigeumensis]MDR7360582.1 cysteine desulfurase [Nocardioides marmoribigeumensis]
MPGYLDSASSEPLSARARETLLAAYDAGWADPLRLHDPARRARLLLDNARAATAEALGVRDDEVSLTPSGTQAVHLGVLGLLRGRREVATRVVHSAVEHSAVFAAVRWAEVGSTAVGVDPSGRVELDALRAALAEPAALVAVQQANPEVGTLQPLDDVADAAAGVPLLVDACATGTRLPLPRHWDVAALSAHKWGGPAGVGVLLVRRGARWRPPWPTDDRVDHRVAGFENVPAALAAAAALQERVAERDSLAQRHARLAERLRGHLAGFEDVDVHGPADPGLRLPHLVSFSFLYVDGEALVQALAERGWSVASGSACTSSAMEPSHVLVAMGALTHGNARVSFAADTTEDDVDRLAADLRAVVDDLRARL